MKRYLFPLAMVFILSSSVLNCVGLDEEPCLLAKSELVGDQDYSNVYQAEDCTSKRGCRFATKHAGYTGSGFMDYGRKGTWIQWNNVSVSTTGQYKLVFRYANGRTANRRCKIIVNGVKQGILDFASTGSWKTWDTETITLTLSQGINIVRVVAKSRFGGPNLDQMSLEPVSNESYSLTVVNGTGSGSYEAFESVAIIADEPSADQLFDGWEINSGNPTIENPDHASTYLTMPAGNVQVTATYTTSNINIPPTADFDVSVTELLASFTDCSTDPDGNIISRGWSFGDGESSTQTDPSHTYAAAGTYVVTLTVTDDQGDSDTITKDIAVTSGGNCEPGPVSLSGTIQNVQPMTGIVLWRDNSSVNTNNIQLEYSYMRYDDVIVGQNQYNWNAIDNVLNAVASRGHQAILRFYLVYPGFTTTVPEYIKSMSGYNETVGISEDETTYFPDWSFKELQDAILSFYIALADRYDTDPRWAFLQVGFGLWAEYHIYDGPMVLGKTFPSKDYQKTFVQTLNSHFMFLRWSISIDAADSDVTPFASNPNLLKLSFGLFDDSFLHKEHADYNRDCFIFFDLDRYRQNPVGGELSYYTDHDQQHALDPNGPHGISFESLAAQYHVSYMIGNDQLDYQSMSRIKSAGMATGYRFRITEFMSCEGKSQVTVKNEGIAPIYYDAYITINGTRATESLQGLLPGNSRDFTVNAGGTQPNLTIESNRLVSGQVIEFDANL